MLNENNIMPATDAPIPGQSLTAPLGDRPWQRPSRFSTAEQALNFYVDRLTEDRQNAQLMDLLQLGVPIDTLVDTLQLGGVMEGLHSVDVGIIITPAIAELVEQMAKSAEVDYTLTSEDEEETLPTKSEIALGVRHLNEKANGITLKEEDIAEELMQVEEDVSTEEPRGLMARRQ
jgi:hypothetical protein